MQIKFIMQLSAFYFCELYLNQWLLTYNLFLSKANKLSLSHFGVLLIKHFKNISDLKTLASLLQRKRKVWTGTRSLWDIIIWGWRRSRVSESLPSLRHQSLSFVVATCRARAPRCRLIRQDRGHGKKKQRTSKSGGGAWEERGSTRGWRKGILGSALGAES